MRKYKGVFFDMDGVVIDSSALWDHITETVKSEYDLDMSVLEESDGFNLSTEEAIRLGMSDDEIMGYIERTLSERRAMQ